MGGESVHGRCSGMGALVWVIEGGGGGGWGGVEWCGVVWSGGGVEWSEVCAWRWGGESQGEVGCMGGLHERQEGVWVHGAWR